MTKKEFIEMLSGNYYHYDIIDDKIVITDTSDLNLDFLTSLPSGVIFNNGGWVNLRSLKSLPTDVEFNNKINIDLKSLTSLSPGVVFNNGGDIYLKSLVGSLFRTWQGNIEGIDNKRLLNLMIKQGVFER